VIRAIGLTISQSRVGPADQRAAAVKAGHFSQGGSRPYHRHGESLPERLWMTHAVSAVVGLGTAVGLREKRLGRLRSHNQTADQHDHNADVVGDVRRCSRTYTYGDREYPNERCKKREPLRY